MMHEAAASFTKLVELQVPWLSTLMNGCLICLSTLRSWQVGTGALQSQLDAKCDELKQIREAPQDAYEIELKRLQAATLVF